MVLIDLDDSDVRIVKLESTPKHKELIKDFDCGDADLNEFLKNDSFRYFEGHLAVTYLIVYGDENRVIGFYCLSSDSIKIDGEDKEALVELDKDLEIYPAMKIGRLGIHTGYKRKHIGTFIIKQVAGTALLYSRDFGCRFVTVDAYNEEVPKAFYANNGFKELTASKKKKRRNVPMYLDLLKFIS